MRRNRKKEISKHEISKISKILFHADYGKHTYEIVVRNNVSRKRYIRNMKIDLLLSDFWYIAWKRAMTAFNKKSLL